MGIERFVQQGPKLVGSGASGAAGQGYGVAISGDGNTALIGAPFDTRLGGPTADYRGAAWVFVRSGTTWTQQGPKLVGAGAVGGAAQGQSVALSDDGNTALIGGPDDNSSVGAAWVFLRSGSTWTQQAKLVDSSEVPLAQLLWSVALSGDGNTALIGSNYGRGSGAAARRANQ